MYNITFAIILSDSNILSIVYAVTSSPAAGYFQHYYHRGCQDPLHYHSCYTEYTGATCFFIKIITLNTVLKRRVKFRQKYPYACFIYRNNLQICEKGLSKRFNFRQKKNIQKTHGNWWKTGLNSCYTGDITYKTLTWWAKETGMSAS